MNIYIVTEGALLSRPALDRLSRPTMGPTMDGCLLTEETENRITTQSTRLDA